MSATLAGQYEIVVLDLDGVVYLGNEAIPGAPQAIQALLDAGTPVRYATNNASRSTDEVARALRGLGVPARAEQIVTSAVVAARVLAQRLPPGSPVLVVGASALANEVRAAGLRPVFQAEPRPLAVVQGYGPEVGWRMLAEACVAIRGGAPWVVTNVDSTLPSPRGPLPGNGSLVAVLATALGGRAPDTVVGKPEPTMILAAARGPQGPRRALVVGDRLDTDIECSVRAGLDSLLVLTGVSTAANLLHAGVHERPTYVAADLSVLSSDGAQVRVPQWRDGASIGGWRVTRAGPRLRLAGAGDAVAALRLLAAAAWASPDWADIEPESPAAASALQRVGLAGAA